MSADLPQTPSELMKGLIDFVVQANKRGENMSTPREVLLAALPHPEARAALAALSAAGFEIVPTALVDAVVKEQRLMFTLDAVGALRRYRAPVLLGQTEETQP